MPTMLVIKKPETTKNKSAAKARNAKVKNTATIAHTHWQLMSALNLGWE